MNWRAWAYLVASAGSAPLEYGARFAGLRAQRQQSKCHKRSKLAFDNVRFGVAHHFLSVRWSPAKIVGILKPMWPDEPQRTASHERIHTRLYAMSTGELRHELIAYLRRAKAKRMPRSRREDRRGQLPVLLGIQVRPPQGSARALPRQWEGTLIKEAGNRSATQALTYEDKKMARQPETTASTGVMVYPCDSHSPWQRGSCEKTNGLIRQFVPRARTCRPTGNSNSMRSPTS